jgi:hypothetical protein
MVVVWYVADVVHQSCEGIDVIGVPEENMSERRFLLTTKLCYRQLCCVGLARRSFLGAGRLSWSIFPDISWDEPLLSRGLF